MYQAEGPAVRYFIGDSLNALESMIRVGDLVEKQHDAGDDLHNKGDQGNEA